MLRFCLLAVVAFLLAACGDDAIDEELLFEMPSLKQTYWEGTLTVEESNEKVSEGTARIVFYTDARGNSSVVENGETQVRSFAYTADAKLLTIRDTISYSGHLLVGDWLLIGANDRWMKLVKNIHLNYKKTLDLKRVQ